MEQGITENRTDLFNRLKGLLPSGESGSYSEDIEDQARAVLNFVVDPVVEGWQDQNIDRTDPDPSTCPNCGISVVSTRTPYCGEACRETAGFARQFRTGLVQGWIFDPAKQVALGQNLWHILGGGRPLRQQIAPGRARATALKREAGRCQVCGAEATTVDHVGSGCNRPINLRAVCDSCCLDRPFGDPRIVDQPAFKDSVLSLAARIGSPIPLRCCDDADTWDWREYLKKRSPVG